MSLKDSYKVISPCDRWIEWLDASNCVDKEDKWFICYMTVHSGNFKLVIQFTHSHVFWRISRNFWAADLYFGSKNSSKFLVHECNDFLCSTSSIRICVPILSSQFCIASNETRSALNWVAFGRLSFSMLIWLMLYLPAFSLKRLSRLNIGEFNEYILKHLSYVSVVWRTFCTQ